MLNFLGPNNSLISINFFKFRRFHFDFISDIIVLFPVHTIRCDDEILVEQSFHTFYRYEHSVVVAKFYISFVPFSNLDTTDVKGSFWHTWCSLRSRTRNSRFFFNILRRTRTCCYRSPRSRRSRRFLRKRSLQFSNIRTKLK